MGESLSIPRANSDGSLEDYCETMAKRGTRADHVVVINMAKMLERDIMIVTSA